MRSSRSSQPTLARPKAVRSELMRCAAISFLLAMLSFGYALYCRGGALTIRADFDLQQMPFTMALHNQVARGGLAGWCWNLDLGASCINGFAFYELGSPFFWASMAFPASAFPFVVGWLYMLKYVVASCTAYLYARRFVGGFGSAMLCATLYAFSGFQATNLLFYHFHDAVALFPLMLIGLERLMDDQQGGLFFVIATCLNALVNYFFFVQDVVFVIIYFLFRFAPRLVRERRLLASVARCLALGVLGTGLAGVLLVPSFIYLGSNPRAVVYPQDHKLLSDFKSILMLVHGTLLPADPMHDHSFVVPARYLSTACWLPMVGPSLSIAYVLRALRKRRFDWLAGLLVILPIVSLSPLLSSGFLLFTKNYQRWWYVLVLMGSLASAMVADDPDAYEVRRAALINVLCIVALVLALALAERLLEEDFVLHSTRILLSALFAALGVCLSAALLTRGRVGAHAKRPKSMPLLLGGVMTYAVASTALMLHYYGGVPHASSWNLQDEPEKWLTTLDGIELGSRLREIDPQYRYDTGDNRLTLPGEACGTSSFSSTVCPAMARFEAFFGSNPVAVFHLDKRTVYGLTELLAGRYRVVAEPSESDLVVDSIAMSKGEGRGEGTLYVVSQDACPIGVLFDQYVLQDDVETLACGERAAALLRAPVVAHEDEAAVAGYAACTKVADLDLAGALSEVVRQDQERGMEDFWRDDHGFGFTTDAAQNALVYLSVPHDDGWTATVDGQPANIVDSVGMMLLPVEAGKHTVVFKYETPGLRQGAACSLAFSAAVLAWLVWRRRGRAIVANV